VRVTGPDAVAHSLIEVDIEAVQPRDLGTITVPMGPRSRAPSSTTAAHGHPRGGGACA
jgi:hypothetical protein